MRKSWRDALLLVSMGLDSSSAGRPEGTLSPRRSLYLLMVRSDRSNYRCCSMRPNRRIAEKKIDFDRSRRRRCF